LPPFQEKKLSEKRKRIKEIGWLMRMRMLLAGWIPFLGAQSRGPEHFSRPYNTAHVPKQTHVCCKKV
jgi:hypothetical protein